MNNSTKINISIIKLTTGLTSLEYTVQVAYQTVTLK